MRPKHAVRHELVGNEIVAVDHGAEGVDEELMITIMDDNDNFVAKPVNNKKQVQQHKSSTQTKSPTMKPSGTIKKNPIQPDSFRQQPGEYVPTESFHTDLSMKDFDIM